MRDVGEGHFDALEDAHFGCLLLSLLLFVGVGVCGVLRVGVVCASWCELEYCRYGRGDGGGGGGGAMLM